MSSFAVPGAILSKALIISIIPSKILLGKTRLKSPGVAAKVGRTVPSSILLALLLRPLIKSPNLCTITPPPNILDKRAILSPYPLLSLNGAVKCFETNNAKLVFSVLSEESS